MGRLLGWGKGAIFERNIWQRVTKNYKFYFFFFFSLVIIIFFFFIEKVIFSKDYKINTCYFLSLIFISGNFLTIYISSHSVINIHFMIIPLHRVWEILSWKSETVSLHVMQLLSFDVHFLFIFLSILLSFYSNSCIHWSKLFTMGLDHRHMRN